MTPPLTWTDEKIRKESARLYHQGGAFEVTFRECRDTTARDCCEAQCEWCRQYNKPIKEANGEWWHKVGEREYACQAGAIRELIEKNDAQRGGA